MVRNSVGNREIYVFLIISCISTITKEIRASKNMLNIDVYIGHAFFTRPYFDVTSCNNLDSKKSTKIALLKDKICYIFSEENPKITNIYYIKYCRVVY